MAEEYIITGVPSAVNPIQLEEEVEAQVPQVTHLNRLFNGDMRVTTSTTLDSGELATLTAVIQGHIAIDYHALSVAAKPSAKTVIADMEALYTPSLAHYTGLSGSEKAAVLTTLTTGWNTATAAQKADALRSTLTLIVIAIYFIYLRFINGGE